MRRPTPSILFLLAGLLALGSPSSLVGQDVLIDEGEFALHVGGAEVGTETFTLRRVGAGDEARLWATATVEQDEGTGVLAMRPVLRTGVDRAALEYQNKISGDGETEIRIAAADRRFVALIKSAAGERERELRATPGAVFLESTVAHQYYFLPSAPAEGASVEVPIIVPRSGEQVRATLTTVGNERVRIGGEAVDAVKVRLTVDGEEREIWRDADGRVLRLVIPAREFRAERREI